MNFSSIPTKQFIKYFRTNIVAGEPQLFLKEIRA